jgi:spore cortex formation protein SpoVR/YcgB (stage V sporulation)
VNSYDPNILVVDADLKDTRVLTLEHKMVNKRQLDYSTKKMLRHVKNLWGFHVSLKSVDDRGYIHYQSGPV